MINHDRAGVASVILGMVIAYTIPFVLLGVGIELAALFGIVLTIAVFSLMVWALRGFKQSVDNMGAAGGLNE